MAKMKAYLADMKILLWCEKCGRTKYAAVKDVLAGKYGQCENPECSVPPAEPPAPVTE